MKVISEIQRDAFCFHQNLAAESDSPLLPNVQGRPVSKSPSHSAEGIASESANLHKTAEHAYSYEYAMPGRIVTIGPRVGRLVAESLFQLRCYLAAPHPKVALSLHRSPHLRSQAG